MTELEVYKPLPQNRLMAKAVVKGRELLGIRPAPEVIEVERTASIGCVVPAYNEEDSIASVIEGLLHQTRLPDEIFIIINNTDDDTLEIAQKYAGYRERVVKGVKMHTFVRVFDMGSNPDKKVGALNYGYTLAKHHDFILGVDSDTILERHCVERLELEMVADTRIGGLSAIYTVGYDQGKGAFEKFLVAGQRANFSSFSMDNLLRNRNMAVLGGQCSLFRTEALAGVMDYYKQRTPWVNDSEVEDSLLSIQIKKVGYATKISSSAYAEVGGMTTMKSLHAQQVKWIYGAADLMRSHPFHPNLRLRWFETVSMMFNITTRLAFITLLIAALSIHAFVFAPVWLIPPVIAVLLNVRVANSMKYKNWKDRFYAIFGAEAYMWLRMGHFASAWGQFFSKVEKDNWGAQANAEGGKSSMTWMYPLVCALAIVAGGVYMWAQQNVDTQAQLLWFGWLGLYCITISQTLFMVKKTLRRQRGFKV